MQLAYCYMPHAGSSQAHAAVADSRQQVAVPAWRQLQLQLLQLTPHCSQVHGIGIAPSLLSQASCRRNIAAHLQWYAQAPRGCLL
jgi:hypothetical protein